MIRTAFLIFAFCLASFAATSDCVPGTLADYIALGTDGCRLGGRVISEISPSVVLSGAVPVDESAISVTPSVIGLNGSLLFSLNVVASGKILQSVFDAVVTPMSPGDRIDIILLGASASSDGVVTGIVDLCDDFFAVGTCLGNPLPPAIALVDSLNSIPSATTSTGPLAGGRAFYGLDFDLTADAATAGTASLEAARLTFTAVPEPGTFFVLLTGLGVLFGLKRGLQNH